MVHEGRLLEFLSDLIRIPSVNPSLVPHGQGELRLARFIGDYLERLGLSVTYQDLGQDRANVIGVLQGTGGGKSLMLNGHIDTVDASDMDIEPFDPVLRDDMLFGRGSYDMKGGVAAMIAAVEAIVRSGTMLRGDVYVACVADEEYASKGTEAVVRDYRTDAAIVCEPTELSIDVAHKGFAWARITFTGVAAHGSLPETGVDAITKAGHFLVALERHAKKDLVSKSHALLGSPSVHASIIGGGKELSTYPARCVLEIERRTIPGEDKAAVLKELSDIIEGFSASDPTFDAEAEVFFYRAPFEADTSVAPVTTLAESCRKVLGREPEYGWSSAWLDSALLLEAGIPTAVFGPAGDGAHSAVEYVRWDSVIKAAEVLKDVVERFCS